MDNQIEAKSYTDTEFFFYMLTCYGALVAFAVRYNAIMKDPPQLNAPPLITESLVTCLESQSQIVPGLEVQDPPASYIIKTKLSLLNAFLYFFMAVFSFIGTPDIFYACKHKKFAPIYLFGFAAWSMSAFLLRRQYQRKLPQSLWTHRIFWISSAAFAVTKMFEDYLLFVNFVLNTISVTSNVILGVYGIYRPEDEDTINLIHNDDIPGFIKVFFETLELNPLSRKIFRIKQTVVSTPEGPDDILQADQIDGLDTKFLADSFKVTNQSRRQEINLLNTLPRRNIFVDKKLQYIKKANGITRPYYFILTQIGNQRFESSRTQEEFQKLEQELAEFFNEKNFPKLSFPRLKFNSEEFQANKSDVLEGWLSEIVKKPIFMINPLLTFLSVDRQTSTPFETYFQFSFRSFCSRAFMVGQLKKKNQSAQRQSLVGYFQEERSSVKMNNLITEQLEFIVESDEEFISASEYGLALTCVRKSKKNERITWKIRKSQQQFKGLNQRIQEEVKLSVPFYYRMVVNLGSKNVNVRRTAFCDYLSRLLKEEQHYCPSLFQFIRFDPIAVEVKMLGTRIELSQAQLFANPANRNSHYFEQYDIIEDAFIQVIRVDKLTPKTFKFKISRKGFSFSRTSEEFETLRRQLKQIYDGVSNVPLIEFEEGWTKRQAKQAAEKFLISLEGLPKINNNDCFRDFYHNVL